MADTSLPLLKAVVARLKAQVSAVSNRVYSDVPQGAAFPYIVVGISAEAFAANDFSGQRHTIRVQAFSRAATAAEVLAVQADAVSALDRQEAALALDAGTLVKCEYAMSDRAFIEDDGRTWQSFCEFTADVV